MYIISNTVPEINRPAHEGREQIDDTLDYYDENNYRPIYYPKCALNLYVLNIGLFIVKSEGIGKTSCRYDPSWAPDELMGLILDLEGNPYGHLMDYANEHKIPNLKVGYVAYMKAGYAYGLVRPVCEY